MKVLLTGAAGFIGAAIATALDRRGHQVIGVDAFIPQAHPEGRGDRVGIHHADIRDAGALGELLDGVDVVSHQAAMVGAGVTVADLPLYAGHNDLGTALVLSAMAEHGVDRLVLASSMVVYGEGRYACALHDGQRPAPRSRADLDAGRFDAGCPVCWRPLEWRLVDETAPLEPRSAYAASKVAQEHYAASWARQGPGAVIALRYHNVYGAGMPKDTPYSGVAAMFRSSIQGGAAPRVFEDGKQMRDFVHVDDVAAANVYAVEAARVAPLESFAPYNICSGTPVSIAEVARLVAAGAGAQPGARSDARSPVCDRFEPIITGGYRIGDVRHIVASPERARAELDFVAAIAPAQGLVDFAHTPLRS